MYCPGCGNKVDGDRRFCPRCGRQLPGTTRQDTGNQPAPVSRPRPVSRPVSRPAQYAQQPAQEQPKEETPKKPRRKATILVAAVVGILLLCLGVALYVADKRAKEVAPVSVVLAVKAYSLDAQSSRIPVKVQGTDVHGNPVDEQQWVSYTGKGVRVPRGTYTIVALGSPIASDGTVYAYTQTTLQVTIGSDVEPGGTLTAPQNQPLELTPIDALEVTDQQIDDAVAWIERDPQFADDASGAGSGSGSGSGSSLIGSSQAGSGASRAKAVAQRLRAAAIARRDKAVEAKKKADEEAAAAQKAAEEAAAKKAEEEAAAAKEAEHQQLIAAAQAAGYQVLVGTVQTGFSADDICARLGVANPNSGSSGGTYDVILLDSPTNVSGNSVDGPSTRTVQTAGLPGIDPSTNGQHVAVAAASGIFASDTQGVYVPITFGGCQVLYTD